MARFLGERGVELPLGAAAAAARLRAFAVALEWPPGSRETLPPPVLYVVEQGLDEGDPPVCDQCRIMGARGRREGGWVCAATPAPTLPPTHPPPPGWQHHPVSTARYHFIIPSPADAPASAAGAPWLPAKLESPSHLLHAALHASGAGHLLRLNGREGGSPGWTGGQLVGVWDALARALRARAVSVEDVSSRGGVALRVLHAVAHGETW